MEAYCQTPNTKGPLPSRIVTNRDLRELKQQYSVRDDMERLHESRINVLREKQAKHLETLVKRQEEELEHLVGAHIEEAVDKEEKAREEVEAFEAVITERRERLGRRWTRGMEVARRRLELRDGVVYGPLLRMEWKVPEKRGVVEAGLIEDGEPFVPEKSDLEPKDINDLTILPSSAEKEEEENVNLSLFPQQGEATTGPMSQEERDSITHSFPPGFF